MQSAINLCEVTSLRVCTRPRRTAVPPFGRVPAGGWLPALRKYLLPTSSEQKQNSPRRHGGYLFSDGLSTAQTTSLTSALILSATHRPLVIYVLVFHCCAILIYFKTPNVPEIMKILNTPYPQFLCVSSHLGANILRSTSTESNSAR